MKIEIYTHEQHCHWGIQKPCMPTPALTLTVAAEDRRSLGEIVLMALNASGDAHRYATALCRYGMGVTMWHLEHLPSGQWVHAVPEWSVGVDIPSTVATFNIPSTL